MRPKAASFNRDPEEACCSMKRILTRTTYLEMLTPCMPEVPLPKLDVQVDHLLSPDVATYRFLYNAVGKDYHWLDRNLLSDEELMKILNDDRIEVHVLQMAGSSAGFSELDRRVPGEVQLMYFGLFPEYIGKGLGKPFLRRTLEIAWSYQPRRVWLHTCDRDHRAALPNYLKAGFSIYDEKLVEKLVAE